MGAAQPTLSDKDTGTFQVLECQLSSSPAAVDISGRLLPDAWLHQDVSQQEGPPTPPARGEH